MCHELVKDEDGNEESVRAFDQPPNTNNVATAEITQTLRRIKEILEA